MVMVKEAPCERKADGMMERVSCWLVSPGSKSTSVGLVTKEAEGF